jgi:hypothetical protein
MLRTEVDCISDDRFFLFFFFLLATPEIYSAPASPPPPFTNVWRRHCVQRVSAKHGAKDDFAFLWEHAIFRHPPNKNPLTDRSEILHN